MKSYKVTALSRWDCQRRSQPPADQITQIHIYDFDNTLFSSPTPNKQIWNTSTCGQLQGESFLYNGGWWHNPRILSAVGAGAEAEEKRAWAGCWNEKIVELVRLSMQDPGALTVLLTGRKETGFGDLIGRMVASKRLEFDIVALKPALGPDGEPFSSTMRFKQFLLTDLIMCYPQAEEIRVYEDRVKHVKEFREFFAQLNDSVASDRHPSRAPITAEVLQVTDQEGIMDPVTEVAEVQQMINVHNRAILDGSAPTGAISFAIKRSVFYTGYLIQPPDIERLKTLVRIPPMCSEHEIRYLANNVLIAPRPATQHMLKLVGGIGAKVRWRVTGVASLDDRVWAARVQPTTLGVKIMTENPTPCVVLATRRQAKPAEANRIQVWQPVIPEQAFEFETTVGEKALLRIEPETTDDGAHERPFSHGVGARKHSREEDFPPLGVASAPTQPRAQRRSQPNGSAWANVRGGGGIGFSAQRGGARTASRGRGSGGARGRGRGGYRSLDSVGQGYGGDSMQY